MTDGTLDAIVALFQAASAPLFLRVYAPMRALFLTLFWIDFAWEAGLWVVADVADFWARMIRKLVLFAILWGLLVTAPFWLSEILEGFSFLSEELTGVPGLSPSAVLDQGLSLFFGLFTAWERFASLFNPVAAFLRVFGALAVLLAFTLIAFALLRVLVEAAIALGALAFFLGFMGHKATWGLAEGYLRYLLNLGVRLLVLYVLVGVGTNLAAIWETALREASFATTFTDPRIFIAIPTTAAIWAGLVLLLPGSVAREITGPFALSGLNPMGRSSV